ncbi:hypothetical protein [Bradyrhizobium japonicum]|uniref:hypothetical protein n=1 Tax=Bradyrhizobium japonicum TaxID=375 RepID=UPI00351206AC
MNVNNKLPDPQQTGSSRNMFDGDWNPVTLNMQYPRLVMEADALRSAQTTFACTAGNAASVRHDQPCDWSWRFIQSIGESREVSHCFARYLQSCLRSREELVEHLIGAPLLCEI